jgi:hypothetical protein
MQSEAPFSYNDRYGVRPPGKWQIPAILCALLGISWLVWAGLHHANPPFRTTLISFSITSEKEVSIRYSLERRSSETPYACTLVARDIDKNVVGQIDEVIPAGKSKIELVTLIPTRGPAVNADVIRCRESD